MTFIKILVPLATMLVMAYSYEIGLFYFAKSLLPFGIRGEIRRAWRFCPINITDEAKYEAILDVASSCYNNRTEDDESLCHSLEDRIQSCSEPLVEFFVDCFPEKAKDLPPAIAKTVAAFVETFCTSSGELLLEAFNPCVLEFLQGRNQTDEECSRGSLLNKFDKVPSKEEVCKVAQEIGECWHEHVNYNCGSLVSKNFISKLINSALAGCK